MPASLSVRAAARVCGKVHADQSRFSGAAVAEHAQRFDRLGQRCSGSRNLRNFIVPVPSNRSIGDGAIGDAAEIGIRQRVESFCFAALGPISLIASKRPQRSIVHGNPFPRACDSLVIRRSRRPTTPQHPIHGECSRAFAKPALGLLIGINATTAPDQFVRPRCSTEFTAKTEASRSDERRC